MVLLNGNVEVVTENEKWSILIADSSLLGKDTSWGMYDIFVALFSAYFSLTFFPTFVTNWVIMVKEFFMKQDAFSVFEDYKDGEMFGANMDLL